MHPPIKASKRGESWVVSDSRNQSAIPLEAKGSVEITINKVEYEYEGHVSELIEQSVFAEVVGTYYCFTLQCGMKFS